MPSLPERPVARLLLLPLLVLILGVYVLLFTTVGSDFATRFAISCLLGSKEIAVSSVDGNLVEGFSFYNLEVPHLPGIPLESGLKIQRFQVVVKPFRIGHFRVEVNNGRLSFSQDGHPIVFSGIVKNGFLDMNIYSKNLGVHEVVELVTRLRMPAYISGTVADFDSYLRGSWKAPTCSGTFRAERFNYKEFSLENSPVSFSLQLDHSDKRLRVTGEVTFHGGTISSRHSSIQLEESRMFFTGRWNVPKLDIKGSTAIEGVKIFATLQGTMEKPDLKLVSEPPLPQEALLLMLATGKRWRNLEGSFNQGEIPLVLARDFLDYFFLSGVGTELAERFGISNVSLTYDSATQGVGLRSTLSDKAELRYGVEQPEAYERQQSPKQKIGAEYKISDQVSIEAQGIVKQQETPAAAGTPQASQKDGQVLLKYKKKF